MADQGRWFKLWVSAIDDPDLGNLALDDFARWCLLGVYLKVHGRDGSVTLTAPARALCTLLRLPDLASVLAFVEHLKNVSVIVTEPGVTYRLTWKNWLKYQGDFSGDRVRAFRERAASEVTRKKRGEERRGDETRKIPSVSPLPGENPKTSLSSLNGPGSNDEPNEDRVDQEAPERGAGRAAEHLELEVPDELRDAATLIEFLNAKTGRTYGGLANLQLVDARLREGWSVQDCRTMVMRKWRDWRDDPKMRPFARPSTLFNRAKLEAYMAELGFRANTGR